MAEVVAFPQGHHRTILVVDDEPAIRAFLCDYLSEAGLHAIAVASADDAVRLLEDGNTIELVFSDVRMPGTLDGFGLAGWVRANRPDVPVLLASGDLGKLNAERDLSGAQIMPKPYDFDMVVRRIQAALSGRAKRIA